MDRNVIHNLCCAVCALAIAPFGTGFRAGAQTPSTELSFEAATVKLVDPSVHRGDPGYCFYVHVYPARATYCSLTIEGLISYAYDVRMYQVTGSESASGNFYNIEATFPEGVDKKNNRRMLQALLKDRFKLAFHIELRQLDSYVLVVSKHGEKLTPSLPDPPNPVVVAPLQPGDNHVAAAPAILPITKNPDGSNTVNLGKRGTETTKYDPEKSSIHNEASKMTMEFLAGRLGNCLGSGIHKVIDETGIKGNYQVAWDCPLPTMPSSGDPSAGMLPSDPQGTSSLYRSLEAMGLKLEKRKIPTDVYVIDHVEKPSEN